VEKTYEHFTENKKKVYKNCSRECRMDGARNTQGSLDEYANTKIASHDRFQSKPISHL